MSEDDGGKSDRQENDVCFDQASDEDGEIAKGTDFVEESSQNECEEKKEMRQAQTPVKKTVWVLVFDVEENKHSPPILLEEIQDKSGRNGKEADLDDQVLYDTGGKLQEAFIVSQSDNKEELDKKYEKMVEMMKQVQERSNGNLWHYTKVIGAGLLASSFTVLAAPIASSVAGVSAGGIAAGSFASELMSWAAIANGGGVAAGGFFATLQSAGIGFFSNLVLGSTAKTAGTENQCKICLDSKIDTVFEPCGHLFTCSSCAKKLRMCPICGKPIQMLHIANNS